MNNLITIDETMVQNYTKEQLVDFYIKGEQILEDMEASLKVIRDELMEKVDMTGEVILDRQVVKYEKMVVKTTIEQAQEFGAVIEEIDTSKITLDQARELGATKLSVDANQLRKAAKKGAVVPGIERVPYLMIKPLNKTKDIEAAA